ncbi:MAG: hypothetical protein JRC86_03165, partial [Deltaproteobacteria bacterium]|nr:hypothetical protein [Deltaproteobacteria bacterium]
VVLDQKAEEAMQPFYDKLNDAETTSAKAVVVAQREVVLECKPFKDYTQALIERLVDENFVDSVGSLTVPVAIREELSAIATAAETDLEGIRKSTSEVEARIRAWRKSVYADIALSVTVADQRALIAKVLGSDPTKAWTFEA